MACLIACLVRKRYKTNPEDWESEDSTYDEEFEKYTREEKKIFRQSLKVVRRNTGEVPQKIYAPERRGIKSKKKFELTNLFKKPSSEGLTHASTQQAPSTQPVSPLLIVNPDGPLPSSGAVRKIKKVPTPEEGKNIAPKTPLAQPKVPTIRAEQQIPTSARKILSLAIAHKEGSPSTLSLTHTAKDEKQLPPLTPEIPHCEDTVHEVLEHHTCLELQSSTSNSYEKQLLESQQIQATGTGKLAAAAKSLRFTELLAEIKELRREGLRQLLYHKREAIHQKEIDKKLQMDLDDLNRTVRGLKETFLTQSASTLKVIATQGIAITDAINGITAMVERMTFGSTINITEETASSSSSPVAPFS